ncbi:hypothetical protein JZO73_14330 [Enterococcus plantarum]|uniref:hypothetical protein n=1 Tax=Enterococcus plantarum TaxID=1077675 RepID=UPI001A8CBAED|nr:hypothetical protein [Enterococcus plantarum]MBO0468683.1 hypothetical protein [Enterococcus plantarum]
MQFQSDKNEEIKEILENNIVQYNKKVMPNKSSDKLMGELSYINKDEHGEIQAGLSGMHIDYLWVKESLRGKKLVNNY